ncbi:MAG: hypothetical protein MJH10_09590 [Epibacterium sp.]|nr:hypothetical protein [Epibacterium sp.]NQX73787.1 hypothetical protein [Epibacterium sp.]
MSQFLNYVMQKYEESGLTQRAFVDKIGVKLGMFRGWMDRNSEPSIEIAEQVLERLGGDIMRALPEYTPPTVEEAPILVHGEVSAGNATISQSPTEHSDVLKTTFRNSRLWSNTQEEIKLIRVIGDSMAPEYKADSLIACRRPLHPIAVKDGTDCIFQNRYGDMTFKRLKRGDKGLIHGVPINLEHELHTWKPGEVDIYLVAIGIVNAIKPSGILLKAKRR